jgi:hypothetical protein
VEKRTCQKHGMANAWANIKDQAEFPEINFITSAFIYI